MKYISVVAADAMIKPKRKKVFNFIFENNQTIIIPSPQAIKDIQQYAPQPEKISVRITMIVPVKKLKENGRINGAKNTTIPTR